MGSRKPRSDKKPPARNPDRFPIVCLGASAGGLDAFTRLLGNLDPKTGMAFVVVQHLDPSHPSALSPLLAKKSTIPVEEAREGVRVRPDRVYVIPPDTLITLTDGTLQLTKRPDNRFMPIDHFMKSLAEKQRSLAIGVILSGTGNDGTLGLETIKAEGGVTFAQDEASAQHPGMPASAAASGCVDFILPPDEIACELKKVGLHPQVTKPSDDDLADFGVSATPDQFSRIFELLRTAAGLDFTFYKRATIRRRIARRMGLHKFTSMDEYIAFLQRTRAEVEALSQDLLIKVTTFFRDAEAFDGLRKRVFPALLKHKKPGDSFRVWIPGCSTGEEVYSIGISMIEAAGDIVPGLQYQIFATDIAEPALEKARSGFYPETVRQDVSPERLRRFFTRTAEGYRISKTVRDLCVFARQDLTKDPPFSKLDLISCRNVLIYMGSDLQKRILPIFHYALNPGGFLMLGSAESTGSFSHLFHLVDKKGKIYAKKQTAGEPRSNYPMLATASPKRPSERPALDGDGPATEGDLFKEADKITLSRYSPSGVLLNDAHEILQFRGHTGPYLEQAPGKPTVNVMKLIREGMAFELKAALEKARKQGVPVRTRPIEVRDNGEVRTVVLEVLPIRSPLSDKPYLLVLFNELPMVARKDARARTKMSHKAGEKIVAQLRRELTAVREEMQSVIEEQEASQEEFKSANEEILSSNEELQSTNEELETAKEELQSANEELTTLNEELLTRNTELGQLNSDITNLLTSISIPILMLSQDLRIRRFTPVAGSLLNLIPGDVGRPITDINPNIDLPRLDEMVVEVIETMSVKEKEVRSRDGRWYSMRIRPYRTLDNKIDGATIVFLDIEGLKKSQQAEAAFETIRHPLLMLDVKLRVKTANPAFFRRFATTPAETIDRPIYELGNGQWNIPALRTLLEEVLPHRTAVEDFEVEHEFPTIGRRRMLMNARRMKADHSEDELILVAIEDVTAK